MCSFSFNELAFLAYYEEIQGKEVEVAGDIQQALAHSLQFSNSVEERTKTTSKGSDLLVNFLIYHICSKHMAKWSTPQLLCWTKFQMTKRNFSCYFLRTEKLKGGKMTQKRSIHKGLQVLTANRQHLWTTYLLWLRVKRKKEIWQQLFRLTTDLHFFSQSIREIGVQINPHPQRKEKELVTLPKSNPQHPILSIKREKHFPSSCNFEGKKQHCYP